MACGHLHPRAGRGTCATAGHPRALGVTGRTGPPQSTEPNNFSLDRGKRRRTRRRRRKDEEEEEGGGRRRRGPEARRQEAAGQHGQIGPFDLRPRTFNQLPSYRGHPQMTHKPSYSPKTSVKFCPSKMASTVLACTPQPRHWRARAGAARTFTFHSSILATNVR
eukprot:7795868-Pyramimonas_sp.AAC.1